jgi:cytochrome b561
MLGALARVVRVIHMTIGISDPKPSEETAVVVGWVVLFVLLVAVFVIGLFVVG